MAKVTRKKIARGSQIFYQHTDWQTDIELDIEGRGVERDQLRSPRGVFWVTLSVPFIGGQFINGNQVRLGDAARSAEGASDDLIESPKFTMPFLLPPPQDYWPSSGAPQLNADVPIPVLDEISFSFDTRREAAAISAPDHDHDGDGLPDQLDGSGRLYFDQVGSYDVKISIVGHTQTHWGDHDEADDWKLTDEVCSYDIGVPSYSGTSRRENPAVISGINKALHPFKSYLFCVQCPGLLIDEATYQWMALVNVVAKLRITYPLVARDTGSTGVQNCPMIHLGAKNSPTVGIVQPAGGDDIDAHTGSGGSGKGLSENMVLIDAHLRKGLRGGYTKWGTNWGDEHVLTDDQGYQCIVLPMFGGTQSGEVNRQTIDYVANSGGAAGNSAIFSARPFPITYPMVIHHVFICLNWQTMQESASYGGTDLADGTFLTYDFGLNLATGLRSDGRDYDPIATCAFDLDNGDDHDGYLIDRIGYPYPVVDQAQGFATVPEDYSWEILSLPLVDNGANYGTSYGTTGKPVWAGRALQDGVLTTAQRRSNIAGANPNCDGAETYLVAHGKIKPKAGLTWGTVVNVACTDWVAVGYGGMYMIVIAKTGLV